MFVYFYFCKIGFLEYLTYRMMNVMHFFSYPIIIFANHFLYQAIYEQKSNIGGFSLSEITTYITISWVLRSSYRTFTAVNIGVKVRDGGIAMDLIKPVSFIFYNLSLSVGKCFYRILSVSIPVALLLFFTSPLVLPSNTETWLMFGSIFVLGFLILYFVDFLIGLLAFYLDFNDGFAWTVEFVISLFAGLVVPLSFFPEPVYRVLKLLPFQYFYFVPVQIFLGKVDFEAFKVIIFEELVWLLVVSVLAKIVFAHGVKKLTIQGG
ncbi:ABC-2 family transporter protein [bacterium]|nr:ABC-2 family transporter protein [bacterium]